GQSGDVDVTEEARSLIQNAVEQYEKPTRKKRGKRRPPVREEVSSAALAAWQHLMAGDYEKVIALGAAYKGALPAELAEVGSRANMMQGITLSRQARTKDGEEAGRLFALAAEKFQAAVNIKPDDPHNLSNWGAALSDQAGTKQPEEANRLFALAAEKYQAALNIKPDLHDALYNRACLYSLTGRLKESLNDLKEAISHDATYRKIAREDNDFDKLRSDPTLGPEFERLVAEPDA
ncbi:unnamed protein product, partial [marine sediment metagenome]